MRYKYSAPMELTSASSASSCSNPSSLCAFASLRANSPSKTFKNDDQYEYDWKTERLRGVTGCLLDDVREGTFSKGDAFDVWDRLVRQIG
jgi:hypothetical protein